jgi:hypothetical protein
MRTVTQTRTLVILGARPRTSASDTLGDVPAGGDAVLVVLGLHPTPDQQRLTEDALTLAAERRFTLTAEMVGSRDKLQERLHEATVVRIAAARSERRRWNLSGPDPITAPGAR